MNRIARVLRESPPRTVITADWLLSRGVYRQLIYKGARNGSLERVGFGAYKRQGEAVTWAGGLYAIQNLKGLAIHVGGSTALQFYVPEDGVKVIDRPGIVLWKTPDTRVPSWFIRHDWKEAVNIRSVTLFNGEPGAFTEEELEGIKLKVSAPERAALEYVHDVPSQVGFYEASKVMKRLTGLCPEVLQMLLESCKSIRTKRLFLYLAGLHRQKWFRKLNRRRIDLGYGAREIVKGARFDIIHKIVVPDPELERSLSDRDRFW